MALTNIHIHFDDRAYEMAREHAKQALEAKNDDELMAALVAAFRAGGDWMAAEIVAVMIEHDLVKGELLLYPRE
jgi:hypothetical protein